MAVLRASAKWSRASSWVGHVSLPSSKPLGNSLSQPLIFLGSMWASEDCTMSELWKGFKAKGSPRGLRVEMRKPGTEDRSAACLSSPAVTGGDQEGSGWLLRTKRSQLSSQWTPSSPTVHPSEQQIPSRDSLHGMTCTAFPAGLHSHHPCSQMAWKAYSPVIHKTSPLPREALSLGGQDIILEGGSPLLKGKQLRNSCHLHSTHYMPGTALSLSTHLAHLLLSVTLLRWE